jgi:hypothetical protein
MASPSLLVDVASGLESATFLVPLRISYEIMSDVLIMDKTLRLIRNLTILKLFLVKLLSKDNFCACFSQNVISAEDKKTLMIN